VGDDLELQRRAVAGDGEALSALLERHGPALRRLIGPRIPPRFRSVLGEDDVMQESYVDAFQDIGGFVPGAGAGAGAGGGGAGAGEGRFAAWLTTIAQRNLVDAIRMLAAEKRGGDRRVVQGAASDESYGRLYDQISAAGGTPSRAAARGEAVSALKQAIESLPPAYRQVVTLYDLEGRPAAVVGEALGRSPGAVYMLRSRAQRLLAEAMGTASKYLSRSP
jgi:RNA polymerase sigma-70 factor (ECF subfamily)